MVQTDSKAHPTAQRHFIPQDLQFETAEDVRPYLEKLEKQEINSAEELEEWILNRQEAERFIQQALREKHVQYTCNTNNTEAARAMDFMIREVAPEIDKHLFRLNKKLLEHPAVKDLPPFYDLFLKLTRNQLELYRKENIKLISETKATAKQYSARQGELGIEWNGKKYTLQQAAKLIQDPDRDTRKAVFERIVNRRLEIRDGLNNLMSDLISKRTTIAQNAGFDNFRDYRFKEMNRFDYTPEDAVTFQQSVRDEALPLLEKIHHKRKMALNVNALKPYDLNCNPDGNDSPTPFENADDLTHKTILAFEKVHPEFGEFLKQLKAMQHLDLESREGKAPGGYNIFLPEKGAPFIFMNAAGTIKDMITMIHEGGHAVHSFYKSKLTVNAYQQTPPEISELASMAMELIAMDHYEEFFEDQDTIKNAKIEQLERVLSILPWIATIDEFQHWLYTNPEHNTEERTDAWREIHDKNNSSVVNWDGYETYKDNLWQNQIHIFEIPFYYIEYGIAQLGAVALWKNYKENPAACLEQFIDAMKMGYSRPIPEVYHAAGIRFDFSASYLRSLLKFAEAELEKTIRAS